MVVVSSRQRGTLLLARHTGTPSQFKDLRVTALGLDSSLICTLQRLDEKVLQSQKNQGNLLVFN